MKQDDQPAHDPVLARIGLSSWNPQTDRFRWELFNWYAALAKKKDLDLLSEGDWLNLQEEIRALRELINFEDDSNPISQRDLRPLRKELFRRLKELADDGIVAFKPPRTEKVIIQTRFGPSRRAVVYKGPTGIKGLLYHFGQLLERHYAAVQRCPHCQQIFIRFRRHARFCSRKCQSVATMRGKAKHKPLPKGAKHGTSRRRR